MSADGLLKYLSANGDTISLLSLFVWALITERIVSGRAHRALQRRCDRWEEIALDGLGITRKAVRHIERQRETDGDAVDT